MKRFAVSVLKAEYNEKMQLSFYSKFWLKEATKYASLLNISPAVLFLSKETIEPLQLSTAVSHHELNVTKNIAVHLLKLIVNEFK